MAETALSIVIPCYNSARTLRVQLDALAAQSWSRPCEVLLADNGSSDDSKAIARSYGARLPDFRIIDASARRGPAFARNEGARYARGKSLAFCDADDEVAPGWVDAMATALATHDFVCSRARTHRLNRSWKQRYLAEVQGEGPMKAWYPPYLPFAGACGLGINRALFDKIGGFDEGMVSCEDTDLCFRVQLAGTPLTFVPDAIVHVRLRSGMSAAFVQARRWAMDNVKLSERYRVEGVPRVHSARRQLRSSPALLRKLAAVRRREDLARWVFELGWHIGILQGSLAAARGGDGDLPVGHRRTA